MFYHFFAAGTRGFFGGRYGVEYFVILSGFLFFSAWEHKNPEGTTFADTFNYWKRYMLRRYLLFFGYGLLGFCFAFAYIRVGLGGHQPLKQYLDYLSSDIWEILLVKFFGFNRNKTLLNIPGWTLGCMLFAEYVIGAMLLLGRKNFLLLLMPLSICFGTAYWINLDGSATKTFLGFFTFGQLRAYLLTCFGIYSYWLCQWLKRLDLSTAGKAILTIIEGIFYVASIYIACMEPSRYYQFCFSLLIIGALAISFSGKSYSAMVFRAGKISKACAKLSLPLYLTHGTVVQIYANRFPDPELHDSKAIEFFAASIIAAILALAILECYTRIAPALGRMCRRIFLNKPQVSVSNSREI